MTDYVKNTDFAIKDQLVSGNPAKLVKGVEINTEFDAIQAAVGSKADKDSPALTGTATAVNFTVTGTLTATVDGGTY